MQVNGIGISIDSTPLEDFLAGSVNGLESGSYEQNINGDGKLSLTWRSNGGGGLSAGTTVTVQPGDGLSLNYYLMDNYAPTANGDGTYTWSPTFVSEDNKLRGVVIYKEVEVQVGGWMGGSQQQQKTVRIYTWPYTGSPATLVSNLNQFMPDGKQIRLGAEYTSGDPASRGVSVSFDQDNIVSACEKIADALGTNCTIEDGDICIGTHSAIATGERYDRFVVLGGTRNMAKMALDGNDTYAAVTLRLQLDETKYPNSIMPAEDANETGAGKMTKFLIFDDIYPKMELTVGSVRERKCYLFDEDGKPLYTNVNGERVPRTYIKFYISLNLGSNPFAFDKNTVIQGRTLGIVFQSGLLAGREFDLAYYDDEGGQATIAPEKGDDDVPDLDHNPYGEWQPMSGEYRICLVADGDTLLPNATLRPVAGDKVTLVGVALDMQYYTKAQEELEKAAQYYVGLYTSQNPTSIEFNSERSVPDFLLEASAAPSPGRRYAPRRSGGTGSGLGDNYQDYIVTSVTTDIITKAQQIHYGTFEPKGLLAGVANLLETASLSGGGATVGGSGDDFIRHTGAMSLDQFQTLYNIVGHLGMRTVNTRIDSNAELLNTLQQTFGEVKDQADRKFDIWFGYYTPEPQQGSEQPANFPASEWDTEDERESHLQDVFYDTSRPAGSTGGRMWRWVRVLNSISPGGELDDGTGTIHRSGSEPTAGSGTLVSRYDYFWEEISDGDTLASLEMLADLSADGILTPSEKLAVRREWNAVASECARLLSDAATYGVSSVAYATALYQLWWYLNDPASADTTSYQYSNMHQITESYRLLCLGGSANITDARNLLTAYKTNNTEAATAIDGILANVDSNLPAAVSGLLGYMQGVVDDDPEMINTTGNSTIDGNTYKQRWSAYRSAQSALLAALSDAALGQLDQMADDDVLTDIEKLSVIREYERIAEETAELTEQATAAGLAIVSNLVWTGYVSAYSALYNYLNDPTTNGSALSSDLKQQQNPAMLYNGETTDISGSTFTGLFASYYTAAAALRTAIRSTGNRVFVGNSLPAPPYKVGDLWVNTSNNKYVLMICINGRNAGDTGAASDWAEHTVYKDPRNLLAALADMAFTQLDNTSHSSVTVTLSAQGNSTSPSIIGAANTLEVLRAMIGDVSFTISWGDGAPSGTFATWSLYCKRVTFQIPGSQETLTGGCQIMMYNGTGWEVIQQSTSSLLNNLGDKINAVVFGSSAAATEAAGLTVEQRFAKMFATAQVWDANANNGQGGYVNLASAVFGLDIDYERDSNGNILYFDSNGNSTTSNTPGYSPRYVSSAKLSADKIEFSGKTITIGASDSLKFVGGIIDFTGSTIKLSADKFIFKVGNNEVRVFTEANGAIKLSANYVDFNVQGFSLSAEKIDFAGKTINLSAANSIGLNASQINFAGQTITMTGNDVLEFTGGSITFNSGTTLNFNAAEINLNADKINWKNSGSQGGFGGDVIPGASTDPNDPNYDANYNPATDSKFYVDTYGNVTMNNLTAINGTFSGTVTANSGYIGGTNGWTIVPQKLYSGTIGNNGSMYLATVDLTQAVSINGDDYTNIRFAIGSSFFVLSNGTLIANDLQARNGQFLDKFTSVDERIEITQSRTINGNVWSGLAVMDERMEGATVGAGGDLATVGGICNASGYSFGRIYLTKCAYKGAYDYSTQIKMSAEDGSITAPIIEARSKVVLPVKTGNFTLPSNSVVGEAYLLGGEGNTNISIMKGNNTVYNQDGDENTNTTINITTQSYIIVCVGTNKWRLFKCV